MKKRVRITSGEDEVIELDVIHKITSENRYELEYVDTENSRILVKAGKESLCLQRDGDGINTLLYFKQGESLKGKAITAYGDVPISTLTNSLEIEENRISLQYVVEGNDDSEITYHWEIVEVTNE